MTFLDEIFARPESTLDQLSDRLNRILTGESPHLLGATADQILEGSNAKQFSKFADQLVQVYAHFFEHGQSSIAIEFGKRIAAKADLSNNLPVHRRILNAIGAQYCEIADFASAMTCLERAVTIARRLKDPTVEAACLANVIAVLQEMGHYRQAITMADRVLQLKDDSHLANMHKLQCASNGLFAAHRIGDVTAAARFLVEGERYLSPRTEPLRRAFFERGRTLYLVDLGEAYKAQNHLDLTIAAIGTVANPKIRTLLTIASSICHWADGHPNEARSVLECLHAESRVSKLYHHLVLQGLVKVYSNASTPAQATSGLAFGRELVEYTTSVKKAKFYRQLANKKLENDEKVVSSMTSTIVDPFGQARAWLDASEVMGPSDNVDPSEQRILTKHEELTAIHEDMARIRASSLRREIQTDAVDTAENWAIAAEFFDDETGQHCYRVGHLAGMLARKIGLDETFCVRLEHAARLHDIGKIAVNEVILLKPGPLDATEMAAMRLHTEVGAQILSGSDDPTLKIAVEVARHHHEWWNGGGYPMKIGGREIPISARVCAFADVYDALTHIRAYKSAWTHERAVAEIVRLAGTQFDPNLTLAFLEVVEQYQSDLGAAAIPAFVDMDSNALISSRRKLMETIDCSR